MNVFNSLPNPFFALKGLHIDVDRETRTLWISGPSHEPLSKSSAGIIQCSFFNLPSDSKTYTFADGSKEYLEDVDALVKIITAENTTLFNASGHIAN